MAAALNLDSLSNFCKHHHKEKEKKRKEKKRKEKKSAGSENIFVSVQFYFSLSMFIPHLNSIFSHPRVFNVCFKIILQIMKN